MVFTNAWIPTAYIIKVHDIQSRKRRWAVWPDWAIFESFWQQICLQKYPQKIVDFWAILKKIN